MNLSTHKICFTFFLFICCQAGSFAQNRYIDSLEDALSRQTLPDTARMETLINIGNAYAADSPAVAKEKYLSVYETAKKQHDWYYQAMAMSGMGRLNRNYDTAMHFYLLADSLYALDPSQTSIESRATNKASIAELEREKNHYEKALSTFLEAISIMEQSNTNNKWLSLAILYSNAGSVYYDLNQFTKVLEYDLKALDAYRRPNNDPSYIVIAELYVAGDYKNLNKLPDAKAHIVKAEQLAANLHSNDLSYRVYDAWGAYYQKTGQYPEAVTAYRKAASYAKKSKSLFREMNCNRMLGFIYRDMKNYSQSAVHMQQALLQTRKLENKLLEAELLKNLGLVHAELGDRERSIQYYQDYIHLSDSLNADETKRKINEIENKYQSEKKQDSILALQKGNALQRAQLEQKATVNLALIVGCGLLVLVSVLLYTNFKNKNRLFRQKEELHAQQINRLEKEKKLLAAQSLLKGQEEERSRLARDLHDGVGGLLSGVKLSMSTMKGNVFLSDDNARSFENVIVQLDQSIAELRRVSHNMMPEALIKYGLKEAVENYCENLNMSGKIKVQLQTYGMDARMEQSAEIVIYRIIQELLNNVIKHAEAGTVLIQLARQDDRFNLTVEDDGKGFNVSEERHGAGLANIKARVDYLSGTMDVVSAKGEGTSVHIEGSCA